MFKWVYVDVNNHYACQLGIRRGARWHQSGRKEEGGGRAAGALTATLADLPNPGWQLRPEMPDFGDTYA